MDQFDLVPLPSGLPVVGMVKPGIVTTMVEYVMLAVLTPHRDLPAHLVQQRAASWRQIPARPASEQCVGILGLGRLTQAAPGALDHLGFQRLAWSRTRRAVPGVVSYAGGTELGPFLARCNTLVCLRPPTTETRAMLNRRLLDGLPRGAGFVNVGRGGHLVAEDLLAALDDRQLSAAVLDVVDPEPLPTGNALWHHPRILLTPLITGMTQPRIAAEAVIANLQRHRRGEPRVGLVDRARSY